MTNTTETKTDTPPAPTRGRFRRFLRRLWKLFLAYVLVSLALSAIPEMPFTIEYLGEHRLHLDGNLRAGAAKRVINPSEDLWPKMNIYGDDGHINGVMDNLHARVLTLGTDASGEVFSIISLDLIIIPAGLRDAVKEELAKRGIANSHFSLSATHTHVGPGNIWKDSVGEMIMGDYCEEYISFLVSQVADAVQDSMKNMRDARIGFAQTQTRYFVKNRRVKEPGGHIRRADGSMQWVGKFMQPVDEELEVIRVDAVDDDSVIAYALNIGAHPTTLMRRTGKKLSAEYPGQISKLLEKKHPGAVALFLQGAAGSARSTAVRPYAGYKGIEERKTAKVVMQGDMLMKFVAEAEGKIKFDRRLNLSSVTMRVALPGADSHFFPEEGIYQAVRILTIIPNKLFNWVADWVFIADETVFQAVRLNRTYLVMLPCDPSTTLGLKIKRHIRRDHVLVLGYANDYSMGYVLTREEYDMGGVFGLGGSERGQCVFGKRAAPMCMKIVWDLANSIREADSSDVFIYVPGDMPQKKPALPPSIRNSPTVQK